MANGITAVVLLNGSARVCGGNGCRELKRPCDCVISTPGRGVTDARKVNRSIFTTLGTARALPFLSGTQSLTRGFGGTAINCGLSMASVGEKKGTDHRQPAPRSAPASPPSPPAPPAPPARSAPPAPPAPPAPTASPSPHAPPAPPDPPDPPTPPKPDKPHKPHGHYGKPHGGYGKPHGGYGNPTADLASARDSTDSAAIIPAINPPPGEARVAIDPEDHCADRQVRSIPSKVISDQSGSDSSIHCRQQG